MKIQGIKKYSQKIKGISFILILGSLSIYSTHHSFASRARTLVTGSGDAGVFLGTGGNAGSFSTQSNYNIFYNPAYIVESKNWLTIEKSNAPGTTAQGGFSTSLLDQYYFSLFFNRIESMNTITTVSGPIGNNYSRRQLMRPIDFTFGTKFGDIKFGLGVSYAFYRLNKDTHDQDLNVKAGVSWMNFDPFVHYKISGKNKLDHLTEYRHKEITGGIRYTWGEWSPYIAYSFYAINKPSNADKHRSFGAGLSRNGRLTENVNYIFSTGFWKSNRPVAKNGGSGNSYQTIVPIQLSAEADVASWIALRAGLAFNIVDVNGRDTAADRTSGRIGSTFKFGAFNMDWVVGNNFLSVTSTTEETAMNAQSFDVSNNLFTAASLTYEW